MRLISKQYEQGFSGGSSLSQTVAVCIPTFNQREYLQLALESVLRQSRKPEEVWISDDASTDGTHEYLTQFEKEARGFSKIAIISQQTNIGMVPNTDCIVRKARTDLIVKLDSDDLLHNDYILAMSSALTSTPDAAYAHCAVKEIDSVGRERRIRRLARSDGFQSAREALRRSIDGYKVAANICMFRRRALEAVQYYRLELSFAEDWDLAIRLAAAGYGNTYVKEVLASYRVWNDHAGYRASRKKNELKAIRNIFSQVIEPELRQHPKLIRATKNAKRNLALSHATCLAVPNLSAHDREALKHGVLNLDNSLSVKIHLFINQGRLASLVVAARKFKVLVKDLVKCVFFR